MTKKVRIIALSAVLIGAAAVAQLALASGEPQRSPLPSSTTETAGAVRPGAGAALPPPLDHVGNLLTQNECKNLGGAVEIARACNTGLTCVTADPAGTVHHACITNSTK